MPVKYSIITTFLLILLIFFTALINISCRRRSFFHMSEMSSYDKTLERPNKATLLHVNGTVKHLGAAKQIFVINLPYRTDRRTSAIALLQALHLDALIVPAYTIYSPEVVSRIHLVHNNQITLVELACWASHMQVWLEIAASENNDSWSFVFEDDIDLEMVTSEVLDSLPRDIWTTPDLIYLGYCGNPPGEKVYEGIHGYRVHQALNPSCTHAYAIRSRTASKLLRLLSSPHRAVDDEIVRLANARTILAFSIHPPLAIQQKITLLRPSDVNPVKDTLIFRIKIFFNSVLHWWQGVQVEDQLIDSALARADFDQAKTWRKNHENGIWLREDSNLSSVI